ETIEALIHRRSCRNYSDRPVEAEKLARIIEAGQYAPSGMGRQPVTFVAVTDLATVERLSQLNAQVMGSNSDPFYGAKTVVVVLVDR
ncbi:nitroreductase family protein, partial [Streptococcus gordonii]|nr:nitroreductase family protein [Streptococcus gordonii]